MKLKQTEMTHVEVRKQKRFNFRYFFVLHCDVCMRFANVQYRYLYWRIVKQQQQQLQNKETKKRLEILT